MLYLHMYSADLPNDRLGRMGELRVELSRLLRPLLQPTVETPASILGVTPETVRSGPIVNPRSRRTVVDGELFTDGHSIFAIALSTEGPYPPSPRREGLYLGSRGPGVLAEPLEGATHSVEVSAIGPFWNPPQLSPVLSAVERAFGVTPSPFYFVSERFDQMKAEGREGPTVPSLDELRASEVLGHKDTRTLAIAIKASGGLLVRDVPKQLPPEVRERSNALVENLKSARLVDSEIVVVCSKTQAQVTRAPTRELLSELSLKGLKCACGRLLADERIEEALAITDKGRALLEKARWLTVLLIAELEAVGVPHDAVLVEQTVGGDEIDCLANISGELALFELKDKEFSLGNAYSFGAKIGIIRPRHPVIMSTEYVGNDAKEHFIRAGFSGPSRGSEFFERDEERVEIAYIEGVHNLRKGVADLVGGVYKSDAINRLNRILPLAALDGRSVVRALENVERSQEGLQQEQPAVGPALTVATGTETV